MKKLKKFLSASKLNAVLFILMVSLVLSATVGAAYASVSYLSSAYGTQIQMFDIGVSILENGERVSWRDYDSARNDGTWNTNIPGVLLKNMLPEGEKLEYGKPYNEVLNIHNSGNINTWVRVSIIKYWVDPNKFDSNGNPVKLQDLDPALIDLHLVNLDSAWLLDKDSSTETRTVLYYHYLLHCDNEISNPDGAPSVTEPFVDTLTIDPAILNITDQDGNYLYDGAKFIIEVSVESVQEHNGQDAAQSAWGRQIIIDEVSGTLNLG